MKDITVLGIDLAKNVFQLHGTNEAGETVLRKQIKNRKTFALFVAKLPPCLIGMEACGSAHHWGRRFLEFGHDVKLLHAKYVKAFVKRNKNDSADAQACNIAVRQQDMKAVPIKSVEQQSLLMLHKYRTRLIKQQTQLSNQIKGFLYELGYSTPKGSAALLQGLPELLEDAENELPFLSREILADMLEEYKTIRERVEKLKKRLSQLAQSDENCQRILALPGVGPVIATAFVASLQGYSFEKGRQAAAWIGLTPKECSSGNTKRLLGISKQGNRYLRCLLIHGARAVVRCANKKEDRLSLWLQRIIEQKGFNKAVVALANKTARRAWSILQNQNEYDQDFADYYKLAA